MGAQLGTGSGKGPQPTINVTPLVDVVLVLLIIFMVIIPNVQDGVPVEMPRVEQGAVPAEEDPHAAVVSMTAEGDLFLDDQAVSRDDLVAKLTKRAEDPATFVRLRADARLPFGEVRDLLRDLKALGLEDVRFAVGVDRTTEGA